MAETHAPAIHGKRLQVVVVTPERAVMDQPADFVALPMFDGELGVLPGRAPLIGKLGIGEMRVKRGEHVTRLFVDGGFAQIRGDIVSVLTPSAQTAEEIKPDAVREALQAAIANKPTTPQQLAEREKAQLRARAKLRLAGQPGVASGGHGP
jgi:F-type H+-transporting ATPase subunit epsilon